MTPDQKRSRSAKVLSAARAIVAQQVGLAVGVRQLQSSVSLLDQQWQFGFAQRFPVFEEFVRAIPPALPLGTARLHWHPESLLECEPLLMAIEMQFREDILCATLQLIKELETKPSVADLS